MFQVAVIFVACLVSVSAEIAYVSEEFEFSTTPEPKAATVEGRPLAIPIISWAGDAVTIEAHGGTLASRKSTLAKAMGVEVELQMVDDFDQQIADYVEGHTPFLRGSLGQILVAGDYLERHGEALKPVVFLLVSWSAGADGVVIRKPEGSSLAWIAQRRGRQLDLLPVLAGQGYFRTTHHQLRFVREAVYHPAAAMDGKCHDPIRGLKAEPTLAAGLGLTHDIVKSELKPTLTTDAFPRVLADVYAVRADFLERYPEIVSGLVRVQTEVQAKFPSQVEKSSWFQDTAKDMAGVFLNDEARSPEFVEWLKGIDLPGTEGNTKFFRDTDPESGAALSRNLSRAFRDLGLLRNSGQIEFRQPR